MAYDNEWITPPTIASDDDEILEDLILEFNKMINDIEMDKIGKAGRRLTYLESYKDKWDKTLLDKFIEYSESINNVKKRLNKMEMVRRALRTTDGWELQRDSYGIKTMYKHDTTTPHIHCLRIEGMVDCPVFDLLALLNEVEYYPQWIPSYKYLGLTMAEKVINPKATQMLNHLKVSVPWPIANRDCLFSVDAIDCISKEEDPRQLIILLKSESGNSYEPLVKAKDMPLPDKGDVVCDILEPSGIVCTPCDNGKTYVEIIEHLDPHISYIPSWLLDLVVRNMCYMILAKVRSAVDIVKKPCYQERMRDPNNAFYMYIRKRIEEDMPEEMKYVPPADGWKCI